ncbi:hypothetical protein [Tychonema sp. LEGE 06208]|uniref:hypothetical protein n=1 Tax=Tychonema sp. LEGE 06208 TaxID=1828663 RepID=UPI0018819C73|nr:hypothetical protein [Tychonema sp. LEGE 06208]MBE9164431.1 hypothetical protein [Tychonema sp. LEGE 06208]
MPTKDEIDDRLKQLAIAAQNHQPKTLGQRLAMTNFMAEVEKYKIVKCPRNTKFTPEIYRAICAEAKSDLTLRICREIHNYRPEKEVSQWVNFLMLKCFQQATPKVIGKKEFSIEYCGDMDLVFNQIQKQHLQNKSGQLEAALSDIIVEDPGGFFEGEVMKKYPQVNFKFLLVKKVIKDESWQEISDELGVNVSSLSTFYQRCVKKFTPRFKEYL